MRQPPPLPGKRNKSDKLPPIDEAEFQRIRRHNRFRVIAIIASSPLLVVASFFLGMLFLHWLFWLIAGAPSLYWLWTGVFPASRRYGSINYKNFQNQKQLVAFREKRDQS